NSTGERFMERYAPTIKDLAPRDMVTRAMANEVREGRGCGPKKDYVLLDLTHLEPAHIDAKLPDITEFARTYLGVEPYTEPVPVFPTAHYAMGGIPTNVNGEVLRNNTDAIKGLYAAGECACVSVHGANRLGTNSLLDINVFGKRAGVAAAAYSSSATLVPMPEGADGAVTAQVAALRSTVGSGDGTERVSDLRLELQEIMDRNVQVFRTEESLTEAQAVVTSLKERFANVAIHDRGQRFNTDLLEAIELGFLLDLSEVVIAGALARTESRGGHYREDFPDRNDDTFMMHTMAYATADGVRLDYKPVTITKYQPMERKY
ncbi:MAG: FAD-binding protein, partial [Demequina sp.]